MAIVRASEAMRKARRKLLPLRQPDLAELSTDPDELILINPHYERQVNEMLAAEYQRGEPRGLDPPSPSA